MKKTFLTFLVGLAIILYATNTQSLTPTKKETTAKANKTAMDNHEQFSNLLNNTTAICPDECTGSCHSPSAPPLLNTATDKCQYKDAEEAAIISATSFTGISAITVKARYDIPINTKAESDAAGLTSVAPNSATGWSFTDTHNGITTRAIAAFNDTGQKNQLSANINSNSTGWDITSSTNTHSKGDTGQHLAAWNYDGVLTTASNTVTKACSECAS